VVEVPGQQAGWLALQAGMAVCADAVLIPEIPYDIKKVAAQIKNKRLYHRHYGLVVVAEGAKSAADIQPHKISAGTDSLKASLSPLATGAEGSHIIDSSGSVSLQVAKDLQRLTDMETQLLVLGKLSQGGPPTVVDRQLGLGYGASAVRALEMEQRNVLVVFQPPDLKFIPMAEAINQFRTVPENSEFIRITRSLGISLGD
jgi:6-phosphofructokinase 1